MKTITKQKKKEKNEDEIKDNVEEIKKGNNKTKYEILKGCFHEDDYKKYKLIEELVDEKGYAYLTLEITKGRLVEVKTIKVNHIIGLRGSAFFVYNGELVFDYNKEENVRIGVDLNQSEYNFKIWNYPQQVPKKELEEMVERLVYKHYDDIYHLWMFQSDVDKYATKLDLNLESRINLHLIWLEFCQKQYIKHHKGKESPIIQDKINYLMSDARDYIGFKKYDKYLKQEKPPLYLLD